ncbi:MAG: hypothetical protein EAZ91_21060 [Cytophagales bacterium]|nr:MAG: hypothetical protein EAZ91_21060 [Cytophagales bacterium]
MAKSTTNRRARETSKPSSPVPPIATTTLPSALPKSPVGSAPKHPTSPAQWQQTVLFVLLLLSLFTPLVFSTTSFFGFVSERGLFFRAVVELMAVIAVFKPGFWRLGWSWLQLSVVLFLVVIGLADVVGVDARLSLLSGFLRMEGFVGYLHLGLYALVLARAGFSSQQWNTAFLTSIGISILVFVVGYFSPTGWLGDRYRFVATVGQPTFLAIYWLIHLFLAAYMALALNKLPVRLRLMSFGIVAIILLWGIILTGARSAVLGLFVGSIATGLAWLWTRQRILGNTARTLPAMAAIIVGITILAVGSYTMARYTTVFRNVPGLGRMADLTRGNNTLPARQITTQIALRSIQERPLLGWGQENYSYAFPKFYDPALVAGRATEWYDRVHCVPLEWACSAGILGFLAYCFLWFWLIRRVVVTWGCSRATAVLLGLLAAYFTFNLLNPDNLLAAQFFFLLIGFVETNQSGQITAFFAKTPLARTAIITFWLVTTLGLAYFTLNGYQTLHRLDKQAAMTNGLERMTFLRTIYSQAQIGRYEVADAVESFAISALQQPDLPPSARQFCYDQALAVMADQQRERPRYGRLLLRISSLQAAAGQYDKAIDLIKQAIALDGPSRPATFMLLGETYLMQQNYPAAMVAFAQAYQLQPRWQLPLVSMAQTAAFQHDTTRMNQFMSQIGTQVFLENLPAIKQAYQTANNLPGFITRILAVPRYERMLFTRPIYQEWILTAFDLGDLANTEAALRDFDLHFQEYHSLFSTADIDQLIADSRRGIRPDGILTIAARLPVNDGIPEWE